MTKLEELNLKLKLELTTIIIGYENELLKCKREEISDFSQGCMERYYDLIKEIKEVREDKDVRVSKN